MHHIQYYAVQGVKPWAWCVLGKHFTKGATASTIVTFKSLVI